jgi:hypothetical protein
MRVMAEVASRTGIPAALARLTAHQPQYNYAVVFDTTWSPHAPAPAEKWDYDPFITRARAEERMGDPQSERFADPELWALGADGGWDRLA